MVVPRPENLENHAKPNFKYWWEWKGQKFETWNEDESGSVVVVVPEEDLFAISRKNDRVVRTNQLLGTS
jgi:hypothetical protein